MSHSSAQAARTGTPGSPLAPPAATMTGAPFGITVPGILTPAVFERAYELLAGLYPER
jgi:hypothetical protein